VIGGSAVWQIVRKEESVHPIIPFSEIQINSTAYRFEGRNYGDIAASFFLVHTEPGKGPSLHTHPYEEVFIVQEGEVTFVVGTETLRVTSGSVVIVPPETPHKFTNSGTTPLRQLSIHPSKEIITTWLEE
jgi:mannose-6-phosphate isomerase-like protein (cupin superfamily)